MATDDRPKRSRVGLVVGVISGVAFVAYPLGAYASLRWLPVRWAALAMLGLFVPAVVLRWRRSGEQSGNPLRSLAWMPLVVVGLLIASAGLSEAGFAMLVPVAMNLGLLAAFAATLVRAPPMIERFARLQVADLTDREVRWCRGWTVGWCAFFIVNASIAAALTVLGNLDAWTTYNGLLAYIAMGTLFGVEYSLRKARFARWGDHPLDRALRRLYAALGLPEAPDGGVRLA